MKVFIDEEDDWYLEAVSRCKNLTEENNCWDYSNRPKICRDHDSKECETNGEGAAYNKLFTTREGFEEYLRQTS